jgi:hypothetical protein
MAKGKNDRGVFGPVSGRLPMDYGKKFNLNEMDSKRPAEESAELAKIAPKAKAIQEEGPAGRHYSESLGINVKKGCFNEERAKAT